MKYAGDQIRTAFITALTGITVDSVSIPVYNVAQIESDPPYILLVNQTQSEPATKDNDCAEHTIIVQCVTKFSGDYGGDWFADQMAAAVNELIDEQEFTTTDFIITVLGAFVNETNQIINQTVRVIIRQLSYQLFIQTN
jgi:hypothetical protein